MLSAIAAGRPLLDEVWLQGCRDAGGVWLEPQKQHAAVDPKQEKELRFSIWDAFERARRNGLLLQGGWRRQMGLRTWVTGVGRFGVGISEVPNCGMAACRMVV